MRLFSFIGNKRKNFKPTLSEESRKKLVEIFSDDLSELEKYSKGITSYWKSFTQSDVHNN